MESEKQGEIKKGVAEAKRYRKEKSALSGGERKGQGQGWQSRFR